MLDIVSWVSNLNNFELACELKKHKVSMGPIVHTTRSLYERKLVNILNKENHEPLKIQDKSKAAESSNNLRHVKKRVDSGRTSTLVEKNKQLQNEVQENIKENRKRSIDLARQQIVEPKQDALFAEFMASDTSSYTTDHQSDANHTDEDDVALTMWCATADSQVEKEMTISSKKISHVQQNPPVVTPEHNLHETRERDKGRGNRETRQRIVNNEDRPDANKRSSSNDYRDVDHSVIRSPKYYVSRNFDPNSIKPRKTRMEIRAETEAKEAMEKIKEEENMKKVMCDAKMKDKPSGCSSFSKKVLLVAFCLVLWIYFSFENDNKQRLLQ